MVLGHRATGRGAETCGSQCRASLWLNQLDAYRISGSSTRPQVCWLDGVGHSSGQTAATAADRLIRQSNWDMTVCHTSPNPTCNCAVFSLWPPDDP